MKFWSCIFHVLLQMFVCSIINSVLATSFAYESDRLALLAVKDHIHDDPHGALDSWNNRSINHCDWYGITCSRRHPNRVVGLVLENQELGEYGNGGEVSVKGDAYSYGMLLLEMFIGKRPTDEMFQDTQDLHYFAEAALPDHVMDIIDPTMPLEATGIAVHNQNQSDRQGRMPDCLGSIIRLGVTCSTKLPIDRMDIGKAILELHRIKDHYHASAIHFE